MKTLLIIGQTYPEPSTTAAGVRMMQLISLFKEQDYKVVFASTASISERSEAFINSDVEVQSIVLNHSSFDDFVKELNPSITLFDRFITEEQFGWRVAEHCPNSLKILDTEDLHFLRKARQEGVKKKGSAKVIQLFSDTAKREIASIYRCDLSLIISEFEMTLLQETFKIDASLLYYLPFLVDAIDKEKFQELPSFENRKHYVTIGNLLHAPNVDSVLFLKKDIWPKIRKQLPEAELHIYGTYAPQQILELHSPKEGFLVKGWAENVSEIMCKARICLAPLRFGAGLKGKFIDAMKSGTPSITTNIGAEGISGDIGFPGIITNDIDELVKASVVLYTQKDKWVLAQQQGINIINQRFNKDLFSKEFINYLDSLQKNITKHRNQNFIGQILQTQTLLSTKYMSRWIEEKNKHII